MQNELNIQPKASSSSLLVASGSRNGLPPTNFTDTLLAELFPESNSDQDLLAPFDYEGFLRREGLI